MTAVIAPNFTRVGGILSTLRKRQREHTVSYPKPKRKKKQIIHKSTFKRSPKSKIWISHQGIVKKETEVAHFKKSNQMKVIPYLQPKKKYQMKAIPYLQPKKKNQMKAPTHDVSTDTPSRNIRSRSSRKKKQRVCKQKIVYNSNAYKTVPHASSTTNTPSRSLGCSRPSRPPRKKQRILKPKLVYHSNAYKNISLFEMSEGEYQWLGWIDNIGKPVVDDGDEKTCAEKLDNYCQEKGMSAVKPQALFQQNGVNLKIEHVIREKKHVKAILRQRTNRLTGEREFLTQWSGSDGNETWEPEIALSNCEPLNQFLLKVERAVSGPVKKHKTRIVANPQPGYLEKRKKALLKRYMKSQTPQKVAPPPSNSSKVIQTVVETKRNFEMVKLGEKVKVTNSGKDWYNGIVTQIKPDILVLRPGFKKPHKFLQIKSTSFQPLPRTPMLDCWRECFPYFEDNQQIYVLSSTNIWRPCNVIDQSESEIFVNYIGFLDIYNEFLPKTSTRIVMHSFLPIGLTSHCPHYQESVEDLLNLQRAQIKRLEQMIILIEQSHESHSKGFVSAWNLDFEESYWYDLRKICEETNNFYVAQADIQKGLQHALADTDMPGDKFLDAHSAFTASEKPTDIELNEKRIIIFEALETSSSWFTRFLLNELHILSLQIEAEMYQQTVQKGSIDLLGD